MKLFGSKGSHENKRRVKSETEPKPRTRKKRIWPKVLIITLAVIAAIIGGAYTAFEIWVRPPEQYIYTPTSQDDGTQTSGGQLSSDETQSPDQDGSTTSEPTESPAPVGGYSNENRYTFLIVGKEPDGFNTDTILVGTFDVEEQWLHVVSIPRDTLVNVSWNPAKINSVYGVCESGSVETEYDSGMDGLLAAVKDIVGYEPAYWAVIDMVAFEKLVDAIGGIVFDVPYDMNKSDLDIHFSAGEQWLSGEDALKVVRYRDYPMGDIDRISVQQAFLKTLAQEMLTLGNIPNIGEVLSIYEEYVETNLASGNIAWFVREFMKLDEDSITFATVPGNYSLSINGTSFVEIYVDEWLEMVNSELSPLEVEITQQDVQIVRYNESWGYYVTSGEVRIP